MIFPRQRVLGFVFKKEEIGEANRLFSVFTKDFGRIRVLGRGIRKISSKLKSIMEIFSLLEIEFVEGKKNRILTDATNLENFKNLKNDLKKLSIAYKISEILDILVRGEERDERIWELILSTFENLNNPKLPPSFSQRNYYYFFWNLISFLGHKPELYFCLICQKKIKAENIFFNEREGGLICKGCFEKLKSGQKISLQLIKILRIILEKDFEYFARIKIGKETLEDLKKISEIYLKVLAEKNQNYENKIF